MPKHTQGPWVYSPDEDGQPILGPHGERICNMDCVDLWEEAEGFDELPQSLINENWEDLNAERETKARLIVAAPELLEALEQLHSMHRAFSVNDNWTIFDDEARSMAEAAIQKAKGE